jgi:succinate-semialdehyde dehydrogenase/glutarate-semialdehyde dehydrogenase
VVGRPLLSIDPTSGERIREWPELSADGLERCLAEAQSAFERWRVIDIERRAGLLLRAAALLRERARPFALLMAEELGKPVSQGQAEVEKCAAACEFYAQRSAGFLACEPAVPAQAGAREYVAFEPLGVVLAIMPWNFPFWQVFRWLAPTLMAGNAGLLKHAENVQGCAQAIEELLREAGFPPGLFRNLALGVERVPALIRQPCVRAVTLTGSTAAGRAVGALAGAALKKCVLELGGSDPYLVLADADLELAARICVSSRLINSGQSCIAAKRFIVLAEAREEFTERVLELMRTKIWGDPRGAVDLGPLARDDLRTALQAQVVGSVEHGARVLLGGAIPEGAGFFYPPTVLADVRPGTPAADQETFGPVAAILEARDEEQAIELANATSFGLGAALFTRDLARGETLARTRLEAGSVFVNDFVRSDPRLPFGGIKDSGLGRELGAEGMRAFVNVKTLVIAGAAPRP